ncbi:MAG: ice-binding family protein [Candidatus Paceibacterota bacterium]|jgi:hypothetical protein
MKKIIRVFVLSFVLSILSASGVYAEGPASINLGESESYAILSKTGISTTGATTVVGDIGVSPAEATYITGFGLILPAGGAYATSSLVTGKIYAPSYATPTPANISTAVGDMQTAYTDGAGRSLSAVTELGAGNIGGLTLAPGLYKWGTGVTIPTDVTLTGSANDVWIFVVAQNLDISSAKSIVLSGGAQARNIFWIVAGQTTIGTGATFNGNILDQTAIVLNTGAVLNGRALAQTAVTLDASTVALPSGTNNSNPEINSNTNSTPNVNSNVNSNSNNDNNGIVSSTTPNTNEEGCSNGNIFNTANGSRCINNSLISQGCSNGNIFNISTGARCMNNVVIKKYDLGNVTLGLWSRGENVKELQRFLNDKLNGGLVIDGVLGSKTTEATKQWQKENSLSDDGRVGDLTKIKMYEKN